MLEKEKMEEVKTVVNRYGKTVDILISEKKLIAYDNARKLIIYSCPLASDRESYTEFIEKGIVYSIDDRIRSQFNPVRSRYAKAMDYRASDNDPDKAIWNKIVETIKNDPSKYFFKNGNWRKKVPMTDIDKVFMKKTAKNTYKIVLEINMTLEQNKKELEEFIEKLMAIINQRYKEIVEALKEQDQYSTPYGDWFIKWIDGELKKIKEAFTYRTYTSMDMINKYFMKEGALLEKREWIDELSKKGCLTEAEINSYNSLENKTDLLILDPRRQEVRLFSEDDFISMAKNAFEYWTHID